MTKRSRERSTKLRLLVFMLFKKKGKTNHAILLKHHNAQSLQYSNEMNILSKEKM